MADAGGHRACTALHAAEFLGEASPERVSDPARTVDPAGPLCGYPEVHVPQGQEAKEHE